MNEVPGGYKLSEHGEAVASANFGGVAATNVTAALIERLKNGEGPFKINCPEIFNTHIIFSIINFVVQELSKNFSDDERWVAFVKHMEEDVLAELGYFDRNPRAYPS